MDSGVGSSEFSDSSAVLRLNMEVSGVAEFVFSLVSSNTLNVFNIFVGNPCARDSNKVCWGSAVHCFCVGCTSTHSSCSSVLPDVNSNASVAIDAGVQYLKLAFHREPPLQLSDSQTVQVTVPYLKYNIRFVLFFLRPQMTASSFDPLLSAGLVAAHPPLVQRVP